MKKVLIVFNHPAPYKVRLFNELAKNFELHVIFERTKANDRSNSFYYENSYNFNEHKVSGIKLGRENFISNQVAKHIKKEKYDLIIMNGYSTFAEMKAIRYLKKSKTPFVLYINGGLINTKETCLKKRIKTSYISSASFYLSPDKNSNSYLEYYGANKEHIYNYPYSTIYKTEIATLNEINVSKNENVQFVSSGQLIKRKNYLSLIKEWKNYPENYILNIFGDGPEKRKISRFLRENHMKNVNLLGFKDRNETLEFFKKSDIFLFPSNEDIYGHVINESLSQGLPVISTKKVNSSLNLIKNEYNGFLLDEFKNDELKNAISYCLSHNLKENCIATAKENTIEKSAEEHIRIFNEVMSK